MDETESACILGDKQCLACLQLHDCTNLVHYSFTKTSAGTVLNLTVCSDSFWIVKCVLCITLSICGWWLLHVLNVVTVNSMMKYQ